MITRTFKFVRRHKQRRGRSGPDISGLRRFSRRQIKEIRRLKRVAIRKERQTVGRFIRQGDWHGKDICFVLVTERDLERLDLILPDTEVRRSWEEWQVIRRRKEEMKKRKRMPRLPMEAVRFLRSHGGAQGSPKGKRGYDRRREKSNFRKGE